eukprot:5907062-Amphidinium_carterae.1
MLGALSAMRARAGARLQRGMYLNASFVVPDIDSAPDDLTSLACRVCFNSSAGQLWFCYADCFFFALLCVRLDLSFAR